MKYSEMTSLINYYDIHKGFWRRWFGDSPYIKLIRKYLKYIADLHNNNETLPDFEVKFLEFSSYAQATIPETQILNHTGMSTLSGFILNRWFRENRLAYQANQLHRFLERAIPGSTSLIFSRTDSLRSRISMAIALANEDHNTILSTPNQNLDSILVLSGIRSLLFSGNTYRSRRPSQSLLNTSMQSSIPDRDKVVPTPAA